MIIDWSLAACRQEDPNLFYAGSERGPASKSRELRAKRVCGGCPLQAACLAWALETGEPHGIWGGLDEFERGALLAAQGPTVAA